MNRISLFPKFFVYTLVIMVFIVLLAHALMYTISPILTIVSNGFANEMTGLSIQTSFDVRGYISGMIRTALPISIGICIIVSVICSLLFSKAITSPVKSITHATQRMAKLDKSASCSVRTKDEIGILAENVNGLYQSLLTTIDNLKDEKEKVSEAEKLKIEFLRTASHELKTPVTAVNAILENMILGVEPYKDHSTYLVQCKEITEQLAKMIHDILETSKIGLSANDEPLSEIDVADFMQSLCEPYQMIAKAKGVEFTVNFSDEFSIRVPKKTFSKAISNILSNAVHYTAPGNRIFVYTNENSIIVENECIPISGDHLRHIFDPFYRIEYARDRLSGGNGLGLYIVAAVLQSLDLPYEFSPKEKMDGMRFRILLNR